MSLEEARKIISPERARYIIENTLLGGSYRYAFKKPCDFNPQLFSDGLTEAEEAAVIAYWDTLPGWTCFQHAIQLIARD